MIADLKNAVSLLSTLRADKRGVTAMEYGLIAALVAVVLVTVLGTVGTRLTATFQTIATSLGG